MYSRKLKSNLLFRCINRLLLVILYLELWNKKINSYFTKGINKTNRIFKRSISTNSERKVDQSVDLDDDRTKDKKKKR
jgi:hypothetical protein